MNFTVTCGGRSWCDSSSIGDLNLASNTLENTLNFRVSVCPVTLVLRLFLHPLDALCVFILLKLILNLIPGERWKLLYSDDCNIIFIFLGTCGINVIVNLTRAKNNLFNLISWDKGLAIIWEDLMERFVFTKVLKVGVSLSKLQQLLWRGYNQRLSVVSSHLSSEQVEIVCCCCGINNLHINHLGFLTSMIEFITQLQHAFDSARRVLWSLTIISVGEQHD